MNTCRAVRASDRVYRALLRAYPREYRQRYGDAMRQVFAELCRAAHRDRGAVGLAAVWLREVPGLVAGALWERNRLAVVMTADALLLIGVGVALSVDALGVLSLYGLAHAGTAADFARDSGLLLATKLTAQTLGAVVGGLGGVVLVISRRITRARPGALAATLGSIHAVIGLSLLVSSLEYPSVLGWFSVAVAVGLALAYLLVAYRRRPDPHPIDPAPAAAARAESRRVA